MWRPYYHPIDIHLKFYHIILLTNQRKTFAVTYSDKIQVVFFLYGIYQFFHDITSIAPNLREWCVGNHLKNMLQFGKFSENLCSQ